MVILCLLLLQPPSNPLFQKFDEFFELQVKLLNWHIEDSKGELARHNRIKEELKDLQIDFTLNMSQFDISKTSKVGAVGSIGYYYSKVDTYSHAGQERRGVQLYMKGSRQQLFERSCKVKEVDGDTATVVLFEQFFIPAKIDGELILKNLLPGDRVKDKVVPLKQYICEYAGRDGQGRRIFNVLGSEDDFKAWKKYRLKEANQKYMESKKNSK